MAIAVGGVQLVPGVPNDPGQHGDDPEHEQRRADLEVEEARALAREAQPAEREQEQHGHEHHATRHESAGRGPEQKAAESAIRPGEERRRAEPQEGRR